MRRSSRDILRRAIPLLLAGVIAVPAASCPASAQGLFDFLFGNLRRAVTPPPPEAQPYAVPGDLPPEERQERTYGPAVAYCVRTCDGHFFPIQRNASISAAQSCQTFCPAAQTRVFSGSGIAGAVAPDGTRYADLPNAFAYRDRIVPGCSCNGKDAHGVARIDVNDDPTLRPGDIVATLDGLATYRGSRNGEAIYTPVNKSAVLLGGAKVSDIRVQGAND